MMMTAGMMLADHLSGGVPDSAGPWAALGVVLAFLGLWLLADPRLIPGLARGRSGPDWSRFVAVVTLLTGLGLIAAAAREPGGTSLPADDPGAAGAGAWVTAWFAGVLVVSVSATVLILWWGRRAGLWRHLESEKDRPFLPLRGEQAAPFHAAGMTQAGWRDGLLALILAGATLLGALAAAAAYLYGLIHV